MIATSGFLAALKCTKFVFGRGSAWNPLGELTALPCTPSSWFRGMGIGERTGKRRERKGGGPPFLRKFWILRWINYCFSALYTLRRNSSLARLTRSSRCSVFTWEHRMNLTTLFSTSERIRETLQALSGSLISRSLSTNSR